MPNKVEVKAQVGSDYKQEIKAGSHVFGADAPASVGGAETAPEPHELLLGALGACTSITLQMYAKRKGWDLKNVQVSLSEEQVEDEANPGRKVSRITREINVEGNLTAEQIDGLKAIADKCPIHKLLEGPKQIATTIEKN